MEQREITLGDLVDAIEQNGLAKHQGSYFAHTNGKLSGGCAFGQAAFNLGVRPSSLRMETADISENLQSLIIRLNDGTDLSLPEIAHAVRMKYSSTFLKRKMRVSEYDYSRSV
jgi:hypothetical protein